MKKQILASIISLALILGAETITAFAADPELGPTALSGDTNITATATQNDPTYIITIPETIDFGTVTRMAAGASDGDAIKEQTFNVIASDVQNLFDDDRIVVRVNASSLTLTTTGATLPFSVYKNGNTTALTGATALFAQFTANSSQGGSVKIDQRQITKAGDYSGTMTFSVSVEP